MYGISKFEASKRESLTTNQDFASGYISTATAPVSQVKKQTPLQWIYATNEDSSPVLPWNIRRDGSCYLAKKDGEFHWRAFASFDDARFYTETKFLPCPHDGRPVPTGKSNVRQLCRHLEIKHPSVYQALLGSSSGPIRTLFVFKDGYSRNKRKLHPEMDCRNGIKCHGINGGCSFNHQSMPWCKNDIDSKNRCRSSRCKYNHGRGRVAHDNEQRSTPKAKAKAKAKASHSSKTPSAPKKSVNSFDAFASDDEDTHSITPVSVSRNLDVDFKNVSVVDSDGFTTIKTKKKRRNKSTRSKNRSVQKPTTLPVSAKEFVPKAVSVPFPVSVSVPTISWKERCALQKKKDADAREAETKRLLDEAEAKRLLDEAETKRLLDEAEAKRIADEAEAKRLIDEAQEHLESQFSNMSAYKKGDEFISIKKSSKKSSKKSRKKNASKSKEEIELLKKMFGM